MYTANCQRIQPTRLQIILPLPSQSLRPPSWLDHRGRQGVRVIIINNYYKLTIYGIFDVYPLLLLSQCIHLILLTNASLYTLVLLVWFGFTIQHLESHFTVSGLRWLISSSRMFIPTFWLFQRVDYSLRSRGVTSWISTSEGCNFWNTPAI